MTSLCCHIYPQPSPSFSVSHHLVRSEDNSSFKGMDSPVNDTESDSDSDIDSDNDNDSDGVIVFPAKMTSSPEKLLWPNTAEQPDPTEHPTSTVGEPDIEELDEWARLKGSNREDTTSQETKDSSTLLLSNGTKELTEGELERRFRNILPKSRGKRKGLIRGRRSQRKRRDNGLIIAGILLLLGMLHSG